MMSTSGLRSRLIRLSGYCVQTFDSAETFIDRFDPKSGPACLLLTCNYRDSAG